MDLNKPEEMKKFILDMGEAASKGEGVSSFIKEAIDTFETFKKDSTESDEKQKREERKLLVCVINNYNLFNHWILTPSEVGYRLSQMRDGLVSKASWTSRDGAKKKLDSFINGEIELKDIEWITKTEAQKRIVEDQEFEFIPRDKRFRGFARCYQTQKTDWHNNPVGQPYTVYEVFMFDSMTGRRSSGFVTAEGYEKALEMFDYELNSRIKSFDDSELIRFENAMFISFITNEKDPYLREPLFEVDLENKTINFDKKYHLTIENKIEEGVPTYVEQPGVA